MNPPDQNHDPRDQPSHRPRARASGRRTGWLSAGIRGGLRGARLLAYALGVVVGLVLLLILSLQLSAVRTGLLELGLPGIASRLPGEVRVKAARWPSPSRIVIEGLQWTSVGDDTTAAAPPADTLVAAHRLEIGFDAFALLRRDLVLRDLILRQVRLDGAAMQRRWAAGAPDTTERLEADAGGDPGGSSLPWVRPGAIPGLPSVEVRNLQVGISRIQLSSSHAIRRIQADGHIDLRHGGAPEVSLELGGRLGPEWPLSARVHLGRDDSLRIQVQRSVAIAGEARPAREANAPPSDPALSAGGLSLCASVDREAGHLRSVRGRASVRVPPRAELRKLPFVHGALDAVPAFGAWTVAVQGSVCTRPDLRGELFVNVDPGDWLQQGTARLAFAPGETRADSVAVRLADLHLTGRWRRQGTDHRGRLTVSIDGSQWLVPLLPEAARPRDLSADLGVRLQGPEDAIGIELQLDGRGAMKGVVVRDLSLAAEGSLAAQDPVHFALETVLAGFRLRGSGRLSYGDALRAELAPWHVAFADSSAEAQVGEVAESLSGTELGEVAYAFGADSLWADDLRLLTPAGRLRLKGHLAGGRTRVHADLNWPDPPEALRRRLAASPAAWDSVRARWDPPYRLTGELRRSAGPEGDAIAAHASFQLPGPYVLGPVLRPGGDWAGLARVAGELSVDRGASAASWTARADLSRTEWIDELTLAGAAGGSIDSAGSRVYRVDSLRLDLLGAEGWGRGRWTSDALAGSLSIALREAELLRRLLPGWDDQAGLQLQADAVIGGSATQPTFSASCEGQFEGYGFHAPRFLGELAYAAASSRSSRSSRASMRLRLPQGLTGLGVRLDSVRVAYEPAGPDTAAARMGRARIELAGQQMSLVAAARVDPRSGGSIRAGTVRLALADRSMSTRNPLILRLPAEPHGLSVDSLDLDGDLGTLRGRLRLTPQGPEARLTADLDLPERPPWIALPAGLWPGRLQLDLQSAPQESVSVHLRAEGLELGPDEDLDLILHARHRHRLVRAALRLQRGDQRLLSLQGRYPADLSLAPIAFTSRGDSLAAQFALEDFPLPPVARNPLRVPGYLHRGGQERAPRLAIEGRASGGLHAPRIAFAGDITFPNYDELAEYRLRLRGRNGTVSGSRFGDQTWAGAETWAGADSVARELADLGPGAVARLTATDEDQQILTGQLRLPAFPWNSAGAESVRTMTIQVQSSGRIDIADLAPLFPRVEGLDGAADVEVSAEGAVANPALEGRIGLHEVQVVLREGTRATGDGQVELSGSVRAPVVDGKITVHHGRIQIPAAKRDLHPREGRSLLWQQTEVERVYPRGQTPDTLRAGSVARADSSTAVSNAVPKVDADPAASAADSLLARGEPRGGEAPGASDPQLELAAEVEIPSGVWLVGRGLGVELTGSLSILRSAEPDQGLVLLGTLTARRGSMNFHGRQLQVEEGTVTFFGGAQINPALDIKLYKRKGGVKVTVHITGTVQDPRLSLSSQPEMSQSDILAFLIFGQRSEGLDQAESRRLEDRALATAEQFAASRLARQIGRELGFDVLEYETSQGDSLGRSITIGRYLSPDLLVKYEQNLGSTLGIGVVIEYYLGNGFQLQMQTRREDQDGIMLNWEHDFR